MWKSMADPRVAARPGRAGEPDPASSPELGRILTADPQLTRLLLNLPRYAASELPILLTGEPGTGKELVAAAICALSPRRHSPYHRINCAVLSESLAGSELFGHLRGSFTDARNTRPGKFRMAHQGTLFLDEVGDLPLSIQPRLLRAVEQGEIEPVGSDTPIQVDVRLVASTNQNLPQLIYQGRFRQDLYDRLAVLELHLPPLRERGQDILLLARHFARKKARRYARSSAVAFTAAALRRLQEHPWPGNVRELKNVITRAVLCNSGGLIREEDLSFTPYGSRTSLPGLTSPDAHLRPPRGRLEELILEEGGNISALARRLRVCTKTIYRWLRFYHLDLTSLRGAAAA